MAQNIDNIIAKGTGAAKSVKARVSGLVGVFQTLAKQHGEVSALLARVKSDDGKRAELWPKIRKELLSHEKAEMREVYPALREHGETSALADHHDQEADELEKLIKKIDGLGMSAADWQGPFDELVSMVLAHAEEEEKEIFPVAQEALGDDEVKALDDRFLATQKRFKESL
jgi:hemerythrin superfamily protein